jgi:hypothetical protein
MASLDEDLKVPAALQPQPNDYAYDLDRALSSVVGLTTQVPADAFTAELLGTERAGNGVLIREDGLVLTIGYLIPEAEEVWIRTNAGRVVQGHVVAYDQVTGFGLVQAHARLDIPVLPIGDSSRALVGEQVVVAGMGGRARSIAAHIVARQEFAGYWEYLLEEAIFTEPPSRLGRHGPDRLERRTVGHRLPTTPRRYGRAGAIHRVADADAVRLDVAAATDSDGCRRGRQCLPALNRFRDRYREKQKQRQEQMAHVVHHFEIF